MMQAEYRIEKKQIARAFSLAAESYDEYASLQRRVADQLLSTLSQDSSISRVLDLGSGTGYCTAALHKLYPNAQIISLDIAEAMLRFSLHANNAGSFNDMAVCADAESLPFADKSFDLVFSSLSIQWCQNYPRLFNEMKRVLESQGGFYISTFGPETLQEVSRAWRTVDSCQHVNRFQPDAFIQQVMATSGFNAIDLKTESIVSYYQNFEQLAQELKSIGASNKIAGQRQGLGGRSKILRFKEIFEQNHDRERGIPVTYQVFYLKGQC